ncbi:DegT/DnrJ/EryC1/StrS family aminotransferase [Pirellulaceae bacterium SH449]
MWPRKLLDITWSDLSYGAFRCLLPGDAANHESSVQQSFGGPDRSFVCLSVRTGFDLLLQALKLPKGSEVMMSAVTIPDMVKIVHQHGLVPIPVDLDFYTLSPTQQSLERSRSPKTRLMVIAPLFGATVPMSPIAAFAREHQILLVEDCAQSFCGWDCIPLQEADVRLYSFGPIKTSTALGGAVVSIRDRDLLAKMKSLHESYPSQSRLTYVRRIAKYALLKLASTRQIYSLIFYMIKLLRRDPDEVVNRLAKNFTTGNLLTSIRKRPSTPLIAMLARRQATYPSARIRNRIALGQVLLSRLGTESNGAELSIPGTLASNHSHWVFPIAVNWGRAQLEDIRKHGFDVTSKHNLTVIEAPNDAPDRDAPVMRELFARIVFLPTYPELTDSASNALIASVSMLR